MMGGGCCLCVKLQTQSRNTFELPMVLDNYDEGVHCQQEEFQELLIFNSVIETFGENHLGTIYS